MESTVQVDGRSCGRYVFCHKHVLRCQLHYIVLKIAAGNNLPVPGALAIRMLTAADGL